MKYQQEGRHIRIAAFVECDFDAQMVEAGFIDVIRGTVLE